MRSFHNLILAALMAAGCCSCAGVAADDAELQRKPEMKTKPIPVILDTDIGDDIDDTWALAMMLKSPELDVKMVVSDTGDTVYRAKIIAKMLEVAGRTDAQVGVGIPFETRTRRPQGEWVEKYDLASYPGKVHQDGVGAMIDLIMKSPQPVTLICIGPVPNIGEALEREPGIAKNARFVGMHGSVYKGYNGAAQISKECNVVNHTPACQKAFTAPWDVKITPLDTCGLVVLKGEKYQTVRRCEDPVVKALMENYRIWLKNNKLPDNMFEEKSSVLFDTVAVYLSFCEDLCVMKDLGIRVTDDGYTVVDEKAKKVRVATDWKDMGGFEDLLVKRLTGKK
ncbi:MAG TPA: nucleoside hydrolase [Candidatus Brocadiia bacterium]|nr:nucleoside hydrolase [Candidatus Brocadiia bacterium]